MNLSGHDRTKCLELVGFALSQHLAVFKPW